MKNYQDDKCSWGYITLCDDCVDIIKESKSRNLRHIHLDRVVKGVPLMEECEACHCKGE